MQLSQGNFAEAGAFYVNAGLYFDQVSVLENKPP